MSQWSSPGRRGWKERSLEWTISHRAPQCTTYAQRYLGDAHSKNWGQNSRTFTVCHPGWYLPHHSSSSKKNYSSREVVYRYLGHLKVYFALQTAPSSLQVSCFEGGSFLHGIYRLGKLVLSFIFYLSNNIIIITILFISIHINIMNSFP